jgi:surface protein
MYNMFDNAYAFNQDISGWNVSNVSNMDNMFSGGAQTDSMTFNQDLSGWNLNFDARSSTFQYNDTVWVLPKPPIEVYESYSITQQTSSSGFSLEYLSNNSNGVAYISTKQNDPDPSDSNPTLTLKRGNLYEFKVNTAYTGLNNTGGSPHPFYFETGDGSEYTSGTTVVPYDFYRKHITNPDPRITYENDVLQFEVPLDAPDTIYYQCGIHSSMRGTINITS